MSFPRYPAYKPSGVEWLGEVPEHWSLKPVFGVASERDEDNKGMKEDNLLSLSYGNIVNKDITTSDGLLPESFETYQIVRPGDIVLRLTDLQNDKRSLRSALVTQTGIITSAYLTLEPERIDSKFLNYLLRAYDVSKVFYSMGGGLRQSMKYGDIKRMPLVIPAKAEQLATATFLDHETTKIDALIAEQQRLIELLQEKRQAVISHAVTKGLNPDAPMKDSGVEWLGEVPEHWEHAKLSNLTTKIGDGLHGTPEYVEESEFYFINGNNLSAGAIVISDSTRCVCKYALDKHWVDLNDSTLLMSINGTIGNFALYRGEPIMLGKSASYINCNQRISREYLCWIIQSIGAQRYFEISSAGTTISNLGLNSMKRMPVALPPLDEQARINNSLVEFCAESDRLVQHAVVAVGLLQERRSALISAAVTGQIDVRGLVPEAEAA